ncbi:glycoside hydrolase [Sarocladium implicatum]|nr:glycoside hydrolase [Sarocladium implicatum]
MVSSLKFLAQAAAACLSLASLLPTSTMGVEAAATEGYKHHKLIIPPVPAPLTQSTNYTVKVRNVGDRHWLPVELYWTRVMVANETTGAAIYHNSSVGIFDFDGSVEISIEPSRELFPKVDSVRVRPLSYNIPHQVKGRRILLTLSEPTNLMVEVNGDVFQVLNLFLNNIDAGPPSKKKHKKVTTFSPGYHKLKETYYPSSGEAVYLATGAVVEGAFNMTKVKGASITGHGIIYRSSVSPVSAGYSEDILIDGPTALSPLHNAAAIGSSNNVVIRNYRAITSGQWGDGIDTWSSTNTLYEKLFLRTADDSVAFYLSQAPYKGNSKNMTVRDSSFWADVAHPINVGGFGGNDTMSDVIFDNIDILDQHEPQVFYQGCLAMTGANGNLVENVLFNNIRVEEIRLGMLLNFKVSYNPKYDQTAGGILRNITVRNLEYNGTGENISVMDGYDSQQRIEFVSFEGLKIRGKLIWSGMEKAAWYAVSDYVPMWVNNHVLNTTWSE